jgi:hypothetical protein
VVPEGGVALQCYQCGQYTDGVGSITPCISYSAEKHLKECPSSQSNYCIVSIQKNSLDENNTPQLQQTHANPAAGLHLLFLG